LQPYEDIGRLEDLMRLIVTITIFLVTACVTTNETERVETRPPLAGTHDTASPGAGPVLVRPAPGAPVVRQAPCVPSQRDDFGKEQTPSVEVGVEADVGGTEGGEAQKANVRPYTRAGCTPE
jgi:hypothetical protein